MHTCTHMCPHTCKYACIYLYHMHICTQTFFPLICLWYTKIKLFLYVELYSTCFSTSIFGFSTIQYIIVSLFRYWCSCLFGLSLLFCYLFLFSACYFSNAFFSWFAGLLSVDLVCLSVFRLWRFTAVWNNTFIFHLGNRIAAIHPKANAVQNGKQAAWEKMEIWDLDSRVWDAHFLNCSAHRHRGNTRFVHHRHACEVRHVANGGIPHKGEENKETEL